MGGHQILVSISSDDLQAFLSAYPGMSVDPATGGPTALRGTFAFEASWGGVDVKDAYELQIEVASYPETLPRVFETGGRIDRKADEHVFAECGRLCLGSELRLRQKIGLRLDLLRFADQCIVPFLYAATRRKAEGRFVLGELSHGHAGLYEDYQDLLGVTGKDAVLSALRILATTRGAAVRHPCPCGCGKRLGQCNFRDRIAEIRQLAPRKVFVAMNKAFRVEKVGVKT
jgi:hypothetical protein